MVSDGQLFHLVTDVPIFWWHAWGSILVDLLKTLGLAGVSLSLCTVIVRYIEERRKQRSHRDALNECLRYFTERIRTPVTAFVAVLLLSGFVLGPYRLYALSQAEVVRLKGNLETVTAERNRAQIALDQRKQNLQTTDPAYLNMIYTIQAFMQYRKAIGADAKCQTITTGSTDRTSPGFIVSALAVVGSNCAGAGLQNIGIKPENEEQESRNGETAGVIVLHALPGAKGVDRLIDSLGNLIQVRRSYKMPLIPQKIPENTIWLQFGPGTKWNTELLLLGHVDILRLICALRYRV